MRYDTTGSMIWSQNWDYNDLNDIAVNLYSSRSRIYVAGGVQSAATTYKYGMFTVLYSDGSYQGSMTAGGTAFGFDQLTAIQYDDSGYVYLTGGVMNVSTGYDIKTIKLDTLLNTVWSVTYTSAGVYSDVGTGLALDSAGNVFVTGYKTSATSGKDYVTIKYSSGGTQRWVSTFDGGINADDSATAIVVNSADTNKIYVTGSTYNGSSKDYWTIRYDGLGVQKWAIGFNNLSNTDDRATSIAVDTLGNVIVAGQNKLSWTSHTYTTVKYVEISTLLPDDTTSSAVVTAMAFSENRGQIVDTTDSQVPGIKFYTQNCNPKLYFSDTAVSYVFFKPDTSSLRRDSLARIDMGFVNSNSGKRIRSMDKRDDVMNFYLPHRDPVERVENYNQLVSFNVWNNVDVVYGSNSNGFKYYFLCKPMGGSSSATQIDLKYYGADSVKIDGAGQLVIYTKLGRITQPKPAAWQIDANGNFSSLGWQPSYSIVGTNEVRFTSFGSYNSSLTLVISIDWGLRSPTQAIQNLEWATYYGGNGSDLFGRVDVDQATGDNFYVGQSLSSNFPTTPLAFQTQNSGGYNAVAVKCNAQGQRRYATYFGSDTIVSISQSLLCSSGAVDSNGYFTIGGRVSTFNNLDIHFPGAQPPGAYVDTSISASNGDAFFAQFDTLGELRWSTYFGGNGSSSEAINDMDYDNNNYLYVVMDADTLTPRVVQSSAYNDSATYGGMILKFDPNLSLIWATRFPGTTKRVAVSPAGVLYVSGTTNGTLPITSGGVGSYVDSTLTGGSDAFIAQFKAAPNQLIWCTYLGGSSTELGGGVAAFGNNVYFTGSTASSNFPRIDPGGGAHMDTAYNGGASDMYITRFTSNGTMVWSTFYGGTATDDGLRCAYDSYGNIYISGSTNSSNSTIPISCGTMPLWAFCAGTGAGARDNLLVCFNPNNWLFWATGYYGGADDYVMTGIATDTVRSKLYFCGTTATPQSSSSPIIIQNLGSGAWWQPNLFSGALYNAFIIRFNIDSAAALGFWESYSADGSSYLSVYPNPNNGEFQIQINSESDNRKIEVYNTTGQLVRLIEIPDGGNSQLISLNLSECANGIYLIVLRDDNGYASTKIIKQ